MNNSDTNLQKVEAAMQAMRLASAGAKDRLSEGLQLTRTQISLLALLSKGPQTTGALAEALFLTQSAVTQTIDTLVRRGLVERRPAADDRRTVPLGLTVAGAELADRIHAVHQEFLRGFVQRLTQSEIEAFLSITDKLTAQIHDTKHHQD